MYTKETLKFNPFFSNLNPEIILDSLTKVISRKYILKYIQFLINHDVPFALGMIDLDNFKLINDNYGHKSGDEVLCTFTSDLVKFIGTDGVVGRYGGDEFLVVYLKSNTYDDVFDFYFRMYRPGGALRKNILLHGTEELITGTVGSASFPLDAKTYDELFSKIDKTLYRGKMKGRNCFIIYVEEKHGKLDVKQSVKESIATLYSNITNLMARHGDFLTKVQSVLLYVENRLRFSKALYLNNNFKEISPNGSKYESRRVVIDHLLNDNGILVCNNRREIKGKSDELSNFCRDRDFKSILIAKMKINGRDLGYLAFAETEVERLWQLEDMGLIMYLTQAIGFNFILNEK